MDCLYLLLLVLLESNTDNPQKVPALKILSPTGLIKGIVDIAVSMKTSGACCFDTKTVCLFNSLDLQFCSKGHTRIHSHGLMDLFVGAGQ